ncbi:hypothetical protein GWI33_001712 [Rhynchophorus ferrugineus]|uniref:Transmembrane protein n=1 Tax=Rhynchophorus ferrugineus TaxID=354439 RepID=A0A834J3A2_RHYFE|nr:hypothetical protein GWI33_001712 [Rhynchophorus ferrugineus]
MSGYFLRSSSIWKYSIWNGPSKRSDAFRRSVFGLMCSANKPIVNEFSKEEVQIKSIEALKCPKRWKKQKVLLGTLDIVISLFLVTPLVVACWRGTWQLMDIYAFYFPPWESFIIGTIIHIIIGLTQESFHEILNRKHKNGVINFTAIILMKIYTVVLNMVTNLHWRGVWIIIDQYFGVVLTKTGGTKVEYPMQCLVFFIGCFLVMFFMKCLRNLNSPPFEICMDYGDDMFLFPNMFKVKPTEKLSLYILDVTISIAVVTNLGVILWRGLWLLVDLYLFPDDLVLSSWASLFLGYSMVVIVFVLQSPMKRLCDDLSGLCKLLIADAYLMFAVMGVIVVWRGIWNVLNIYFLPDDEELSCWLCHWVSMIILMIMGCSNSVLVRGVCIDCEEPDGTCVIFPCNYLRVIFKEEKYQTWFSILSGKNKSYSNNYPIDVTNYLVVNVKNSVNDDDNNNIP